MTTSTPSGRIARAAGRALVYASHLDAAVAAVRAAGDDERWRIRLGTALWHGDKSSLHLTADVLDVRPVRAATSSAIGRPRRPTARWSWSPQARRTACTRSPAA
jgi:hypothetical protein